MEQESLHPLGMFFLEMVGLWSEGSQQLCWFWGPVVSDSDEGQGQPPLVPVLGPSDRVKIVIWCWFPLVLSLEALMWGAILSTKSGCH